MTRTHPRDRDITGTAYYEYRHVVDIADTGTTGTVHDVSYGRWQSRCREMFLFEHLPALLDEIKTGLIKFTVLDYGQVIFTGIRALDEVFVRMRVDKLALTEIGFVFDHLRLCQGIPELAARGWQRVACKQRAGLDSHPAPLPEQLRLALSDYVINPHSVTTSH
ncbi:MAG: acyl-CoA thioesterase [Streptosporangiaceae bacterium]